VPVKKKLRDKLFKQYLSKALKAKKIAELTGYNEGYTYKMQKRILAY